MQLQIWPRASLVVETLARRHVHGSVRARPPPSRERCALVGGQSRALASARRAREASGAVMLSLWQMLKVVLLLSNSVAIMNRPRFLNKFEAEPGDMSLKGQVLNFFLAAQYLRPMLIPLNMVCIFVELLFGG